MAMSAGWSGNPNANKVESELARMQSWEREAWSIKLAVGRWAHGADFGPFYFRHSEDRDAFVELFARVGVTWASEGGE